MELSGLIPIGIAGALLLYARRKNITPEEIEKAEAGAPGTWIVVIMLFFMFLYIVNALGI
jgi:hypothetical protein